MEEVKETKVENQPAVQEKFGKWIIAVLCLLVVFQAVVLVLSFYLSPLKKATESGSVSPEKQTLAKLTFTPSQATIKKNESVSVDVVLTPKKEIKLDGADIVLSFSPQVLQITQVTTSEIFSFVFQKKEKEKEGKIYLTFLEEKSGGLLVKSSVKLLTLTIKGKATGTGEIAVLTAGEGPTSVITESETSRKLPFDYENFKVTVN